MPPVICQQNFQPINESLNLHQSSFSHRKEHGHYRVLYKHFNEGYARGAKCKVQIEEKLEGSGRNAKNAVSKAFEYFQSYFCKLWIRLS